jgi:hypothetical protein
VSYTRNAARFMSIMWCSLPRPCKVGPSDAPAATVRRQAHPRPLLLRLRLEKELHTVDLVQL